MTTYVLFQPNPARAYQFSATLDNQGVTCVVPWSLFGNRWYLSMLDTNGNQIVFRALVASPDVIPIRNITWDENSGVLVETVNPHLFDFMQTCNLTLSGINPDVLNGIWSCFILGPTTFSFKPVGQIPSPIQAYGQVSQDINLAAGYFFTSTLVFRQSTKYFEINP